MWIIGVVILVPIGLILIHLIGMAFMYSHDASQENIADSLLLKYANGVTNMESYHVKLQQELQGTGTKEFLSYYNEKDEMMDTRINRWVEKENVVITDMKVFQTDDTSTLTHVLITYHSYLTTSKTQDILDEYSNELHQLLQDDVNGNN